LDIRHQSKRSVALDSGLMFAWLPKLFVFGLTAAALVRVFVSSRIVAWVCGAILPVLCDVAKAAWSEGAPPSDHPHFWFPDLAMIYGMGLLATTSGAFFGTWIGGWIRRITRIRFRPDSGPKRGG
jgi:hypothetical protein